MALLCGSTSVTFPSSSSKSSFASHNNGNAKTPFLVGLQLASSKPSIRTNLRVNSRAGFQVRCQDLSMVPKDERWMFEESEVNGPVQLCSVIYLLILSFFVNEFYGAFLFCMFSQKMSRNFFLFFFQNMLSWNRT